MDPLTLAAVSGAISLLEKFTPALIANLQSGQVSDADQQALLDRISKLRTDASAFQGPEWEQSGRQQ